MTSDPAPARSHILANGVPAWGHFIIGVGLLAGAGFLDSTMPFERDWSIFYALPLLYAGYNLHGRIEASLHAALILAVFLVPLAVRPEMLRGGGLFQRSTGMGAGMVVLLLMWERRRYVGALRRANDESEGKVFSRTSELKETNKRLRTEIAERKQAESLLREAQRIARLGSWVWELQTNTLRWSDEVFRIYGLIPSERGMMYCQAIERIHPDDRPMFERATARTLNERERFSVDHRIVLPDGETRFVHTEAVAIADSAGQPLRMTGIIQDITERKLIEQSLRDTEERFLQLAENIHEVFWLIDPIRDKLLYVSPAYEGIWGRSQESLYLARLSFVDSVLPEDRPCVLKLMEASTRGERIQVEYRIRRPDGSVRLILDRAYPKVDGTGTVVRVAGIAEDITDRRRAEEEARQHLMQLAHVNRVSTMGEMAAGIAHELNQPLSAIAGFTYAARLSLEQDASAGCGRLNGLLAEIEGQSLRAGEIVKRVRRLVRKAAPQSGSVDPNELIETTLAFVQTEARIEQIHFVRALDPNVPPLTIDAIQIQQVILNLVRNAMEAVSEMNVSRRKIIIESIVSNPSEIEISVRDFGTGLSTEALTRVFEAFFTTKSHGLGMGLAISRSIVESHGGQLHVESAAGYGARFYFSLPVSKDA